jgi:ubiquinone biosynthesis protein
MSEMVSEFMHITYDNKIRLPTQFAVLIKAMITVEGTGRVLYPEFSISAIMREFTGEVFKHRYNLKNILYNAGDFTEELFYDLKAFPKQLRTIIKMLEKNQIKITLDEIKFKKLEREINRTSNKLSLSIIISAIIVGSSLALDTDVGPTIFNLPLFSFAGYVISVIIGMVLIVSIILENFKK